MGHTQIHNSFKGLWLVMQKIGFLFFPEFFCYFFFWFVKKVILLCIIRKWPYRYSFEIWPRKQLHTHPIILVPCLWALWRYKAERDHPAADALVWCSMKRIAVQTIIYDVYLARTGNCDIGTSHDCGTVGPWDWSNTVQNVYGTVSLHGAIVKRIE